MKKLYLLPLALFAILILDSAEAYAQKSLRIRISNVYNSPGTDCDGAISGDSDWEWQFNTTGSDPCIEAGNNNSNNWNPNVTIYGTYYYYSRDCWPGGSFNIGFRGFEDDGTGNCDGECGISHTYVAKNYRSPASNGTFTDWNDISRSTSCNCPTTITYRYDAQQIVGGSWPASNTDGNGYVNNQTCATAKSFNSSTTYNNQANQCRNIWYKYTAPAGKAWIRASSSSGGTVYVRTSCGSGNFASGSGSVTVNCPSNGTTYYFYVGSGGSNLTNVTFSSSNLSGSNVSGSAVTNTSACTASTAMGTNYTGTLTSQENRCVSYTWYKYVLTASDDYLTFNPSSSSDVRVYYSSNTSCGTLCQVASGSGSANVDEPQPGTYYVRVTANAQISLVVSRGGTASNDYIWNATNLGAMPSGGGLLQQYTNNFGASAESGEPNQNTADSDNETDWFYFTTGSTVPSKIDIGVQENGDNIDADFHVYKLNDNGYSFPRCGVNWGKLTSLGDGDGGDNIACVGSYDSYRTICVEPNSKYFIQVRGYENGGFCSDEHTGDYRVYASGSTTAKGPDNVCDAHDFGTIWTGYGSGNIYYNNACNSTQGGEQRTGDMSHTMWYKFRTPANGLKGVTIGFYESGEGANYSAVTLYQATASCGTAGLIERAFDRWCGSDGGTISYDCLPGNTDFYIQGGTGYNFDLCTNLLNGGRATGRYRLYMNASGTTVGPDKICNATGLGSVYTNGPTRSLNSNNFCSGSDSGEPNINTADGDNNTTWYSFTTTADVPSQTRIFVEENGDNIDADYHLYRDNNTGSCATNFSDLISIGDGDGGDNIACIGSYNSDGYWCLQPSSTYYIQVRGYANGGLCDNEDTGEFNVSVNPGDHRAGPDAFCNAFNLVTSGDLLLGKGESFARNNESNVCASDESNEPEVDGNDETVWYKFTTAASVGTNVDVHINRDNDIDPFVAVYMACSGTGSCPSSNLSNYGLSQVAFAGTPNPINVPLEDNPTASFIPSPNTTYYIQVDGYDCCNVVGGPTGEFDVSVTMNNGTFNVNDEFCNATNLGTLPNGGTLSQYNFNNYNASAEENCSLNEPNVDADDETVWFKFTTSANPDATIEIDASADGGTGQGDGLICIGGNTIFAWIKVYEETGTISCPFTPGSNGFSQIGEPAGISYGIDVSDATLICPEPNTTYWIQVDESGLATCDRGQFDLVITSDSYEQGPDDLCDAISIGTNFNYNSVDLTKNDFSNYCSTDEATEPNTDGNDETVWYKFTTGANPGVRFDAIVNAELGSGEGGVCVLGETAFGWIRIFESTGACGYGNIVQVGDNWDITGISQNHYYLDCPQPNTTYYLQIEVGGASTCDLAKFDLRVEMDNQQKPVNDNLCDAFDLATLNNQATITASALNGGNNFTTYCSSKQAGEPNVDFDDGWGDEEGSVWFKFKVAGNIGDDPTIGAMTEIWATQEGDVVVTEQLFVRLYEDPGNCNTLNDLIEHSNREDEAYYYNDILCIGQLVVDETPRTRIYGCLEPGMTYYVQVIVRESVLGAGGPDVEITDERGHFNLHIDNSRPIPADNDDFVDATATPVIPNATLPPNNGFGAPFFMNNENNLCATVELFEDPDDAVFDTYEHTVWYSFIAPASGSVQFQMTSDNNTSPEADIEEEFIVYQPYDDGNPATNPDLLPLYSFSAEVSAFDPLSVFEDGEITWDDYAFVTCLTPGDTYYVAVDGDYDSPTGYCPGDAMRGVFDLEARDYDIWAPSNQGLGNNYLDFICNPKDLMAGQNMTAWRACYSTHSFTVDQLDNYCADNVNEAFSSPWDDPYSNTVWYTFEAPASGKLEITVENELDCGFITALLDSDLKPFIDLRAAVYDLVGPCDDIATGNADAALELKGSVENFFGFLDLGFTCASLDKSFEVECLIPGRTYYLLVDGKPGGFTQENDYKFGEFQVTLQADPRDAPGPNDLICDAEHLGDQGDYPLNTTSLRPRGSLGDPYFCMGAENNFCMEASGDPVLPGFNFWGLDQTAWYSFEAPGTGAIRIDAFNVDCGYGSDNIDLQLAVVESQDGTCTGDMIVIDADYNPSVLGCLDGLCDETMEVQCLDPGQTYWLIVDGGGVLDLVQGCYEVTITEIPATETPPVNDDLCSATLVSNIWPTTNSTVTINNQTNRCANLQSIPDPATFGRDHTVWYKFQTPGGAGPYALEVRVTSGLPWPFGDAVDPQFALYEFITPPTCNPSNVEENFSNYGVAGVPFYEEDEIHCLKPSTWYYLMVDGSLVNSQGNFTIDFESITPTSPAPNDMMCDAAPAGSGDMGTLGANPNDKLGVGLEWNNFCATTEAGEPDPAAFGLDRTVWFSFVTPNIANNVNVDIELDSDPNSKGDGIDLQVAIYESDDGTCSGHMWEIESDYDPVSIPPYDEDLVDLCLKPNTRYFVQVDGANSNIFPWTDEFQGYFDIVIINNGIEPGPVNDDFCSATLLTVGVNSGIQNNFCATTEANEPLAGTEIQASVWYKFVAPLSGRVNIDLDKEGLINWFVPEWNLWDETEFNPLGFPAPVSDPCTAGAIKGTTNFEELEDSDLSIAWSVDYECLFPGRMYYIQVDGIRTGIDLLNTLEGEFNIEVTDLIPAYGTGGGGDPEPANNACEDAVDLTSSIRAESCQFETGVWDASWDYGTATRSYYTVPAGCGSDCGDTWFKFTMPGVYPGCEDPGLSYVKIEGLDDSGLFGLFDTDLEINAYSGSCGELTLINIDCDNGGIGDDVDYSIAANAGETIYLQIFSNNGDVDDEKEFALCISHRKSADKCLDAVAAGDSELNVEYCWDVRDATPDDLPSNGYEVNSNFGVPQKSAYFKYTTDDDFCWGYELVLKTDDLDEFDDCADGSAFKHLQLSVYYDNGALCDDDETGKLDYEDFNDCDLQYLNDVYWTNAYYVDNYPPTDGDSIPKATDIIIQLEGTDDVIDGTIELRQICEGREWEHVSAIGTTTSDGYCEDPFTGWRHYFNDNNTTASSGSLLADSDVDFSGTQGLGNWTYGTHYAYDTYGFTQMPNWNTFVWYGTQSFGTPKLDANGGHPGVDDLVQSVRRWTSNYDGDITIDFDFYDRDQNCGDGAHIRVNKNSVDLFTWYDIPGTLTSHTLNISVVPGDIIDFVIDPKFNAGCDDTHLSAEINADIVSYSEDDRLIFSVHPNGNTNFDGVASVTLLDNFTSANKLSYPIAHRFSMRRYWNFELDPGRTIDSDKPVAVRFYYQESEKDEIIQHALDWKQTHEDHTPAVVGLVIQPFEWFKTDDGVTFDPSFVKPYIIENTREGMSESGQYTSRTFTAPADALSAVNDHTWDSYSPIVDFPGGAQDRDDDARNEWCNGVEYVELYGITAFSGGTGSVGLTYRGGSPLPVELVSFVGWNEDDVNQLEWVTASEINNELFVVERSTDGIDFVEIGSVPGNGTTSEEHIYNLTDFTPIIGVNYYRLRIIDFDGTYEYSAVIAIEVSGGELKNTIVKLHPNPTIDIINLQLQASSETVFDLQVWDVNGRILHNDAMDAQAGLNPPIQLNVLDYAQGVYIIKIADRSTGEVMEAKFVKQ